MQMGWPTSGMPGRILYEPPHRLTHRGEVAVALGHLFAVLGGIGGDWLYDVSDK